MSRAGVMAVSSTAARNSRTWSREGETRSNFGTLSAECVDIAQGLPENLLVEKQQRRKRLVLCARASVPYGEISRKASAFFSGVQFAGRARQ